MTTSMTQELSKDLENLEKRVFNIQTDEVNRIGLKNAADEVFIWENPLKFEVPDDRIDNRYNSPTCLEVSINGNNTHEGSECSTVHNKEKGLLPGPHEFGGGNPFLMFLCIAVLCQHRDAIMKSNMDYNEIAMHFDKMVRKHNVMRVLSQARILYAAYLKQHKQNFLRV